MPEQEGSASLLEDRRRAVLESQPGLIERFEWWLPKQIDKVWRKTIRLQGTRVRRIPYAISRSSDYVAFWAMKRCMRRLKKAKGE